MAKRKSTVRSASRAVESEIIAVARSLAEHPERVAPACAGDCVWFCPFKKARKEVTTAHAAREDVERLKKLSKHGTSIGRSYASSLRLARENKVPFLANFRVAGTTIPYVIRGKGSPVTLVGVQHHNKPNLRLLTAAEGVKNRGLHVYAVGEGLVCSGKRVEPPPEFVDAAAERVGVTEVAADGTRTCAHPDARPAIHIEWTPADLRMRICSACTTGSNAISQVLDHAVGPKLRQSFSARVELGVMEGLPDSADADVAGLVKEYVAGKLTDDAFIARAEESRRESMKSHEGRLLIAADITYPDVKSFVAALEASDLERDALEAALAEWDRPLILERASAARALAEIWHERGDAALRAVGGEHADVSSLFDPDTPASNILGVLKRAAKESRRRGVDADLPAFKKLPGAAALADRAARTHRLGDRAEVVRLAEAEPREKAVGLAILYALDAAGSKDWRYSPQEQELAQTLKPCVQRLFSCPASEYADALSELAHSAGVSEAIETA